jgi:hypothetical protein
MFNAELVKYTTVRHNFTIELWKYNQLIKSGAVCGIHIV